MSCRCRCDGSHACALLLRLNVNDRTRLYRQRGLPMGPLDKRRNTPMPESYRSPMSPQRHVPVQGDSLDDAAPQSDAVELGLLWERVSERDTAGGHEIQNAALATALETRTEFSPEEWQKFNVEDLSMDMFVKAHFQHHYSYYKPVAPLTAKQQERLEFEVVSSQNIYLLACEKVGTVPKKQVHALLGRSPRLDVGGLLLGKGILALAEAISYGLGAHSRALKDLNVGGNKIDDDIVAPLSHSLSRCHALRRLDLGDNVFTGRGLDIVLHDVLLPGKVQIEALNLSKNRFDDVALIPLVQALEHNQLPSMTELDIGRCQLGDDTGKAIGAMLASNTSLSWLSLSWNKFRKAGADAVAAGLLDNANITSIDLSWNSFGDMSPLGFMCEVLGRNTTLTHLNLGRNRVTGNGCTVLAAALAANTSLLLLELDGNPVGAAGAKEMVTLTLPDDDSDMLNRYEGELAEEDEDEERPVSSLPQKPDEECAAVKGAFAKRRKDGKPGIDISLQDCTLGPQESSKNALQFDEDEPAGNYELNLARIFDRTVLRALVKLALQEKGGFKASSVRLDGKIFAVIPSLDFECPMQGILKFSFNSYSSSKISANNKVYRALEELFEKQTLNVRREVLMDMVCKVRDYPSFWPLQIADAASDNPCDG